MEQGRYIQQGLDELDVQSVGIAARRESARSSLVVLLCYLVHMLPIRACSLSRGICGARVTAWRRRLEGRIRLTEDQLSQIVETVVDVLG